MFEITGETLLVLFFVVCGVVFLQFLLAIYMFASLKIAARERAQLNKEMFGLLRKIEGMTANRREQMLKHYDKILEDISMRLPPTIAAKAGEIIFETESKLLSRLAEIEPNLKDDQVGRKKMDGIIQSMETLESTIVSLTANTVQNVMADKRRDLFNEKIPGESSLAA